MFLCFFSPTLFFWQALQFMTHTTGKLPFITVWGEWLKRAAWRSYTVIMSEYHCSTLSKNKSTAAQRWMRRYSKPISPTVSAPDGILCPSLKRYHGDYRRDVTNIAAENITPQCLNHDDAHRIMWSPPSFFQFRGVKRRFSDLFAVGGVCAIGCWSRHTCLNMTQNGKRAGEWVRESESHFMFCVSPHGGLWGVSSTSHK